MDGAVSPEATGIRWFETLGRADVQIVGGKNASLGELIRALSGEGVRVPGGFATTADAYRAFVRHNDLSPLIESELRALSENERSLQDVGTRIRRAFHHGEMPPDLRVEIENAYAELGPRYQESDVSVAVRSSATAEDLPEASFAGQQETYLNVRGAPDVLEACRKCFASLFTDRAISYRAARGFDHLSVALSVGVQKMVRSDLAGAGVMFSLDADTGFPDLVMIGAAWGLGETVVQGSVEPDEYRVFKPKLNDSNLRPILGKTLGAKEKKLVYSRGGSAATKLIATSRAERETFVLSDEEILTLARWAVLIERHYEMPMDMEWAKDGCSGDLFCVQARPETVFSQRRGRAETSYEMLEQPTPVATGVAIGQQIAVGCVRVLRGIDEMSRFHPGDVLVAERTDPDWGPLLKIAAAVVTDHGGRTSHAAIVSRELGVPAVVGARGATETLKDGQMVTVSCAEGSEGRVYLGAVPFETREVSWNPQASLPVTLMINLATPDTAFRWWRLPVQGVGLARMEFIINDIIKVHPLALTRFEQVKDQAVREEILSLTSGYADKKEYFVDHLARGIATIAASQYPHPAIVRMSDFKSNEYRKLIGGSFFELTEENPMIGFRGACRYYSPRYEDGFALECQAVIRARDVIGLDNIIVMIPFVRTLREADRVIETMARHGLRRGEKGLQIYMMCEIPSNVILLEKFAERFDGFSIGSNDLTQLILGIDRDSEELRELFDERNEAVKIAIGDIIERAHRASAKVGICGQAPSDYPDFAEFLIGLGIDSISLNPTSVVGLAERLLVGASTAEK